MNKSIQQCSKALFSIAQLKQHYSGPCLLQHLPSQDTFLLKDTNVNDFIKIRPSDEKTPPIKGHLY